MAVAAAIHTQDDPALSMIETTPARVAFVEQLVGTPYPDPLPLLPWMAQLWSTVCTLMCSPAAPSACTHQTCVTECSQVLCCLNDVTCCTLQPTPCACSHTSPARLLRSGEEAPQGTEEHTAPVKSGAGLEAGVQSPDWHDTATDERQC